MKPQCRECEYWDLREMDDASYCEHPEADGEQIFFYYPQQRRPKWCPLMPKKETKLKPGDKVVMTGKYYEGEKYAGKIWTVASVPWKVCCTEVVALEGFRGGYAVDGLRKVKHE